MSCDSETRGQTGPLECFLHSLEVLEMENGPQTTAELGSISTRFF